MSTERVVPMSPGRFFGAVRLREEHAGFAITHLRHAEGRRMPFHSHANAYFSLVRTGGYGERFGREDIRYAARSVGFHPPGIAHRDEIAPGGASFLIVEVGDALYRRAVRPGVVARSLQDRRGGELSEAALRLDREWRDPARRSTLVVEGVVLEMLGLVERSSERLLDELPMWLSRTIDQLHATLGARVTIGDLAREADVPPVRLARVFRRRLGMGVGEYVQRLRVRWVEDRLDDAEVALSQLALEAGFADQSHMTRVFRRVTGRTPGEMRGRVRRP